MATFLTFLTAIVSLLLILIILLQRGRGGGLTGALGGMGGQSAFGTKAGDVFTRITVVLAIIWVMLNGLSIFAYRNVAKSYYSNKSAPAAEVMEPAGSDSGPLGGAGGEAGNVRLEDETPPAEGDAPAEGEKPAEDAGTEAPATEAKPAGDAPAADSPASDSGTSESAPAEGSGSDQK